MRTLRAALASTTPLGSLPRLYEFSRNPESAESTLEKVPSSRASTLPASAVVPPGRWSALFFNGNSAVSKRLFVFARVTQLGQSKARFTRVPKSRFRGSCPVKGGDSAGGFQRR